MFGHTKGMSRRAFLGGAGLAAVSAGLAGSGALTGCAPQAKQAVEVQEGETLAATGTATGASPFSQINPQDWDFTSNSIADLGASTMAEPLAIGSVTMANRLIKTAATSGVANDPTQAVAYFGNIARGGIGGIFVEGSYCLCEEVERRYSSSAMGEDTRLYIDESPLAAIVEEVHGQNVPVFVQMKWGTPGIVYTWGNTPAEGTQTRASELTDEDIALFIQDVAASAKKLQGIGFDGIELNCAGDNIPAWFLSRLRNDRPVEDPYGPATFETRTRFVAECIQGIKEACGADFPVQVRMNGIEENDSPIGQSAFASPVEEVCELAKLLEAAGADSFHLILGVFENHEAQFLGDGFFGGYGLDGTNGFGTFFDFSRHFGGHLDGSHSGCGLMLGAAAKVKEAVSVPVGAATYMDPAIAPDMFEAAVAEGKIDFLFMNRPVANADPDYPSKLFDNRIEDIRPCTRCLHCAADFANRLGVLEGCRVNACKARAFTEAMPEGYEVPAADGSKKIVVVGGGPAGLEAARVCAERGYEVSLLEKNGTTGGLLSFAELVKGRHENLGLFRDWLGHAAEAAGVNIVCGTEANADTVRGENPDVVIIAVGGMRSEAVASGTDATPVVSINDFMAAEIGENVVVAGFNAQAYDTAQYLLAQGKRVTMVAADPIEGLGKGQSTKMLAFTTPGYFAAGGRALAESSIESVGDGAVTVRTGTGAVLEIPCDAVVDASDMVPNTALASELASEFEVVSVGDCADPWDIQAAIATANLAARAC